MQLRVRSCEPPSLFKDTAFQQELTHSFKRHEEARMMGYALFVQA